MFGETSLSCRDTFSLTLYICLSVCWYLINVKAAEPIKLKVVEATHVTQRKFMDAYN